MLLIGLALATALWSGVQAINAEARASYDRAASALGQDRLDRLVSRDGAPIPQTTYIALRRAGWPVSPIVEGRLARADLRLIGIEPLTLPREAARSRVTSGADFAAFTSPKGQLLVAPDTVRRLSGLDLPPLREDPSLPPGTALGDIGIVQQLLGMEGKISHLVLPPGAAGPSDLAQVAPGLDRRAPDTEGDIARLTESFHLNLTAFGFLAFAVGLFIVHSAIGLAFEQRRPVFRTLRALGLSRRALIGLLLAELTVLALAAGIIGVALGYLVATALLPDVAATLRGLYGAEVPGTLGLRPSWWAAGIGIAVTGTFVAAGQSLWRLRTMPLLAPAQPRAWARASARSLRRQSGAGAVLLAMAALLLGINPVLWSGFAGLAALLLLVSAALLAVRRRKQKTKGL